MAPRVVLGESKLRTRRRRRRVLVLGLCVLAVLVLLGGVVYLTWAPLFRVTTVRVEGVVPAQATQVEQVVRSVGAGRYVGIFSKNNILLYPTAGAAAAIAEAFPSLKNITVQTAGLHTIVVGAVERQPSAVWCGSAPTSSSNCIFLDDTGLAYAPSLDYTGVGYRKYFGRLSTSTSADQGQYLTAQRFHTLDVFVTALQTHLSSSTLVYVFVDENNDVYVAHKDGFEVRFELLSDPGSILQTLQLALSTEIFKAHTLSDFAYLDLRFGSKLYYKLK